MLETIQFKSTFVSPALTVFGDTKYVVPGWIKVPMETTLNEVYNQWYPWFFKHFPQEEKKETLHYMVKSSGGKKEYLVEFDGYNWHCECVGFQFHRKCRHIEEVKLKLNL